MSEVGPSSTVREASAYVTDNIATGVHCPCCGSWLNTYSRRLNRAKVRELQALYRWADDNDTLFDYFSVPATGISLRNREYPKLRFWQLLEARDPEVGSGDGGGYWRITVAGVKFVRGELKVPNKIIEFRSQFLRFADDAVDIDIHESLLDRSIDPEETD